MGRSVLLQLARDSIEEVFEARRTIDKVKLFEKYPLLKESVGNSVAIYLKGELRGLYISDNEDLSLLESIVRNAKKSAFQSQDFATLTTSDYLSCEIEITLFTNDGDIKERDSAILKDARGLEHIC